MCDKCNDNNKCTDCTCNTSVVILPVTQHLTDDIFFNSCILNDKLPNLNLSKGTDLTTILKKVDYKLGDNLNIVNFLAFNLAYLAGKYDIATIKTFAEAISLELGNVNSRLNSLNTGVQSQSNSLSVINDRLEKIRIPNIVDNASIGFTVNDDLNTILQKIVIKFNSLNNTSTAIVLSQQDTNTFDVSLTGVSNTTIRGNVKISNVANNKIQVFTDGLYVSNLSSTTISPILYLEGNKIGIEGSNFVTLPVQGIQQLGILGDKLSISGGNTITLPSLTETPLIANSSGSIEFSQSPANNHTVSANVKISSITGNRLTLSTDGLYISMNATDVLNQIAGNTTLKEVLCDILATCPDMTCYKWYIQNTLTTAVNITYVDVNSTTQTLSINGSGSNTVSGTKILTNPNINLIITFQGKC